MAPTRAFPTPRLPNLDLQVASVALKSALGTRGTRGRRGRLTSLVFASHAVSPGQPLPWKIPQISLPLSWPGSGFAGGVKNSANSSMLGLARALGWP